MGSRKAVQRTTWLIIYLSIYIYINWLFCFSRESNFPRLGQMIIDYENPFKKLSEEFTPHAQRVGIALNSLNILFKRRNIGGEQVIYLLEATTFSAIESKGKSREKTFFSIFFSNFQFRNYYFHYPDQLTHICFTICP